MTQNVDLKIVAERILDAARTAVNEEELKMRVEPIFQETFKLLDIAIEQVHYELPVKASSGFKGRTDAVYGLLYIEYDAPNSLSKPATLTEKREKMDSVSRNSMLYF